MSDNYTRHDDQVKTFFQQRIDKYALLKLRKKPKLHLYDITGFLTQH